MSAVTQRSILVVDDETAIAEAVRARLESEGYHVLVAADGPEAIRIHAESSPDLVVLDLMLPGMDGLEVCKEIQKERWTPVLMLTARTEEADKVAGFAVGADDYLTKPFSLRELAARVRAVLRRKPGAKPSGMALYRGRHLIADFDAVAVTVDGEPIRLTRREFELLRCLVENRNRVLSRDRLLERVWGYDQFIETRSVDVHVGRLRSKLGSAGRQIETVVGLGYRFVE
jgi:DNA-binding response OmpR family regulator